MGLRLLGFLAVRSVGIAFYVLFFGGVSAVCLRYNVTLFCLRISRIAVSVRVGISYRFSWYIKDQGLFYPLALHDVGAASNSPAR